jgi:hypothetical protein
MGAPVMVEVWKPIKGYEDFYEVSDQGRIRSKDRVVEYVLPTRVRIAVVKGKILKTGRSNDGEWGYLQVHLYGTEGRKARKCMRVHRLVAEAFLGPPPYPEAVVMHKDDNVTNNMVTNLEWGTPKDNSMDRKLKNRGARGESIGGSRLTDADIPKIRGYAKSGMTCYQIAKKFPVSIAAIRFVVIGQTWKHVLGVEMP